MARYKAQERFSLVIVQDGKNIPVVCAKGDIVNLTDSQYQIVERDLPGYLTEALTAEKPKTKAGTKKAAASKTRQVKSARDRAKEA